LSLPPRRKNLGRRRSDPSVAAGGLRMAKIYPDLGFTPLLLTAADPNPGSSQACNFTTEQSAPPDSAMMLAFVAFAYPEALNDATPPPPLSVQIQTDAGGWQKIEQTTAQSGPRSLAIAGGTVNYTFEPAEAVGVFRIRFTEDNKPFHGRQWGIRFTNFDGEHVDPAHAIGVTFVVTVNGELAPWIATPGQSNLSASGPATIDFNAALDGVKLAGAGEQMHKQFVFGKSYSTSIAIGNYGPGPLVVSAVASADPSTLTLSGPMPLTVAPGCSRSLTATFKADRAVTRTVFSLACNDPIAAATGANAHFNTIPLRAAASEYRYLYGADDTNFWIVDALTMNFHLGPKAMNFAFGPSLAITPDLKAVYLCSKDIKVFDTTRNEVVKHVEHNGYENRSRDQAAIDPLGRWLYVLSMSRISVIDTQTNIVARVIHLTEIDPWGMTISPDGQSLYLALGSAGYAVVDVGRAAVVYKTADNAEIDHQIVCRVRPTPDGRHLYLIGGSDHWLGGEEGPGGVIVDARTNHMTARLPATGKVTDIGFAPDGKFGYFAEDRQLRKLDLAANTVVDNHGDITGTIGCILVHPSGRTLYVPESYGVMEYQAAEMGRNPRMLRAQGFDFYTGVFGSGVFA